MKTNKRDDFLIIVATIVAILSSKIADFILPTSANYKIFNSGIDIWVGFLINVIILIIVTLIILGVIKFLVRKIM